VRTVEDAAREVPGETLLARAEQLAVAALFIPIPVGIATWWWAFSGDPSDRSGLLDRFGTVVFALVAGSVIATGLAVAARVLLRLAEGRLPPERVRAARFTRGIVIGELVLGALVLAPVVLLALDASDRLAGERSVAFVVAIGIPAGVAVTAWIAETLILRRLAPRSSR